MIPDIIITPPVAAVIGTLVATIVFMYRAQLSAIDTSHKKEMSLMEERHDSDVAAVEEQRDSYMKMASRATWALEASANRIRAAQGLDPLEVIAPVIPEHNSPTTPEQQAQADFHTMQAKVVAAAKALDVDLSEAPKVVEPVSIVPPVHMGQNVVIAHATVEGVDTTGEHTTIIDATIRGDIHSDRGH